MGRNRSFKLTDAQVTPGILAHRTNGLAAQGFPKPKWIRFCEVLLAEGYTLTIYEARQTASKYITVSYAGVGAFKVRFSNHKPIANRELAGDCDFFVGITNFTRTHSLQAVQAVRAHFKRPALVSFNESPPVDNMFAPVED